MKRLSLIVVAICVLGCAVANAAVRGPKAALLTSGDFSERVETVAITSTPGAGERSVISRRLPLIETGDRVLINAEVQASTTCVYREPRCIGRRYGHDPHLEARLILSSTPSLSGELLELGEGRHVRCHQRRPDRNHHCTLVFTTFEAALGDPAALPCAQAQCYVNLVVGAWNPKAKPAERMVIGGDLEDGSVEQDKGRVNVIRIPYGAPVPTVSTSAVFLNPWLPLNEPEKVKRRVLHSIEIAAPRRGEVVVADASWIAGVSHLPFNAFINSRLVLAETPTALDSTGVARSSSSLHGEASEANGFNCTRGRSGYTTPCTSYKTGAVRITADLEQPLYLNLVASAKPLLARNVKHSHRIRIYPGAGLTVQRFTPPIPPPAR